MRLPLSTVEGWDQRDLVSAVTDLVDESEQCPGCGLMPDDAKRVEAVRVQCPMCEDRDRAADKIPAKHWFGWRVRFQPIADPGEAAEFSSHARFTLEGARERYRRRKARRR